MTPKSYCLGWNVWMSISTCSLKMVCLNLYGGCKMDLQRIPVRQRLLQVFGHRVVALYYENKWPPWLPGLTSCEFLLWGYLKSRVFVTHPHSPPPPPPPPHPPLCLRNELECQELAEINFIRNSVRTIEKRCLICNEKRWTSCRTMEM